MKIKKYIVREMQEAMRLIREDMGPEAVIISSYRLPRKHLLDFFRPPQLEVTAALDELPAAPPAAELPPGPAAGPQPPASREGGTAAAGTPSPAPAPQVRRTRREEMPGPEGRVPPAPGPAGALSTGGSGPVPDAGPPAGRERGDFPSFRAILKRQEEAMMDGDVREKWRRRLLDMEVLEGVVEMLLDGLEPGTPAGEDEDFLLLQLKGRVVSLVEEAYSSRDDRNGKIRVFIGPTGAGKTTTLAKLAARQALFERKRIALVAVYSHRFGAVEELKFYGQTIGVPVEVVMTPAELASAVEAHQDKETVFIDTEGISCRNAGQLLKLKGFVDALPPSRRVYLVLSATTRNRDLLHMAREFDRVGYSEFIFTKLDETQTRGGVLNLVHQMRRPVSYVTGGQNVPDDIAGLTPRRLAALLLEGVEEDAGALLRI
ncbi:flagellar biosynthesis protein FlhF [Desulfofundulus australicus DSM 11792]|uniref:Flagellar biosynthesis protein FlhF n=1 Tax=Desulfofundulus australicus DSM 11792 TaxID=1121425 RepID=A0A1M4VIV5_9FIRM|nr:flagellar biosynthesis protein FlhF [Desulfofundulus australicus]SHE68996.1 flagellar biosynthesis protein FlhF [Desulfofundulus australicus DSM 11792]